MQKIEPLKLTSKSWLIANIIWIELMQLLSKSNEIMRKFLGDMCRVKNFHFMLQRFKKVNSPEEMAEHLEAMLIRGLSSIKDINGEVITGKVRDQSK